jgi:endonuclease YncB( thermonuclease family)
MRIASLLVLAELFMSPANAAAPVAGELPQACPAKGDVPASFASAVSASSFRTREGKEIRLAGVIGPGEDGESLSVPAAAMARSALASMLSGEPLTLSIISGPDRYQRLTAEVFAKGDWVQISLLRKGLLRVAPEVSAGPCLSKLLSAEEDAAGNMAGHWNDGSFTIRTPDQLTGRGGKFEIVQGEVWRTRVARGKDVIEFASASSFELTVSPEVARMLRQDGVDVRHLRGAVLRVRGWVGLGGKPEMEISQPEALQLIRKPARRR